MSKYGIRVMKFVLSVVILGLQISCAFQSGLSLEVFSPYQLKKKIPDEGARIHYIQLTNGEASLIQLENGKNILIDTGSSSAEDDLMSYLKHNKVKEIHYLIITNDKEEHIGNFSTLMKHISVEKVYFPYSLQNEIKKVMEKHKSLAVQYLRAGDKLVLGKNASIEILNPGKNLSLTPEDNSLVLQLEHEKTKFLFTSDISEKIELELVKQYDLHSHILKVSDYGSNQASHADFLEEVDAHIAIIFHRPDFYLDPEVIERLEESWMEVYPLKKHGHIVIVSDQQDYRLYVLSVPEEDD